MSLQPKLASLLVLLLLGNCVEAQLTLHPPTLSVGDPYRLAFTSSGVRDGTGSSGVIYDEFVQAAADAAPVVGHWDLSWQALLSTTSSNVRFHTNTHPELNDSVPIYRLDGLLFSESYQALYDDTGLLGFDNPLNLTELGTVPGGTSEDVVLAWSGSFNNGQSASPLGPRSIGVTVGSAGSRRPEGFWGGNQVIGRSQSAHVYAISEEVMLVPEPSSGTLLLFASLAIGFVRRCFKQKPSSSYGNRSSTNERTKCATKSPVNL